MLQVYVCMNVCAQACICGGCLYACMIWTCVCLYVWVCVYGVRVLCVHVYEEASNQPCAPFLRHCPLCLLRQGPSLSWNSPNRLSCLARKPQGTCCLCVHSAENNGACRHTWLFHEGSVDQIQGLTLKQRALDPAPSPSPKIVLIAHS